jgi:hypothetical protein
LLKKPERNGTPEMASAPTRKVPKVHGILLRRPPIRKDIELPAEGMHHTARAQEQQRLKERVRCQVKHASGIGADAHPKEHVT